MKNWTEIFQAGDYRASGRSNWTPGEIDAALENTRRMGHVPELVIDHPVTRRAKVGEFSDLRRVGESVFAAPARVHEGFRALWNDKVMAGLSAGWRKGPYGYYLDHVAACANANPVVKTMQPAEFSEKDHGLSEDGQTVAPGQGEAPGGEEDIYLERERIREFTETEFSDFMSEISGKGGKPQMDEATKKEIQGMIGEALKPVTQTVADAVNSFSEKFEGFKKEFSEKPGKKEPEKTEFSGDAMKLIESQNATIAKLQGDAKRGRVENFMEKLVTDGKLLPAEKAAQVEFAMALDDDAGVDFADGKKTPLAKHFEMLASRPKVIDFGEAARDKRERGAGGTVAEKQVREYYQAHAEEYEGSQDEETFVKTAMANANLREAIEKDM